MISSAAGGNDSSVMGRTETTVMQNVLEGKASWPLPPHPLMLSGKLCVQTESAVHALTLIEECRIQQEIAETRDRNAGKGFSPDALPCCCCCQEPRMQHQTNHKRRRRPSLVTIGQQPAMSKERSQL